MANMTLNSKKTWLKIERLVASHPGALGVVGGGVEERGRPPVPRVVEAVVPTRGPGVDALAAQDDDAT